MTLNKTTLLSSILLAVASTSIKAKDVTVSIMPDTVTVLRNPLNGWVMYLGRNWDEQFWTNQGYDAMPADHHKTTVKVSDYANTCYIRTSWRSFEPEEGQYIWKNPHSRLMKLLRSCLDRHMKLAFRIVVDSRDQGQNTPLYPPAYRPRHLRD